MPVLIDRYLSLCGLVSPEDGRPAPSAGLGVCRRAAPPRVQALLAQRAPISHDARAAAHVACHLAMTTPRAAVAIARAVQEVLIALAAMAAAHVYGFWHEPSLALIRTTSSSV